MAEPKQPPPSLGDAPAAKKAAKKVSRPKPSPNEASPAAATVASAAAPSGPSASAASPVPMLHLSEPKLDPGNGAMPTESKPRASKKRTSTPPTGGPGIPVAAGPPAATGPSMGPNDAAAMAKQAADVEKEKQAAAARREAKRLRAKELEDAKRREELAKQALEEAKRQEEQRQREARRQQELAALNANAEECQDEEPEERNDYDDEGFENYDDDFENDDDQSAQGKAGSKSTAAASTKKSGASDSNDKASALELKKIQQALQAESKELLSSSRLSSSSKSAAANDHPHLTRAPTASSSIASSIAGLKKSMDPRAKRVKEVLEARKMEVDKFNLFQQAPLSDLEKYMTHLRRGNVRQAFVQTNDGAKAEATQTKPPVALHKGMHFPDDIGLDVSTSSSSSGNPEGEDHSSTSTVRFFKFLEHAAYVCEVLAEENVLEAERDLEAKSQQARKAISSSMTWTQKQIFPTKKLDNVMLEKLLQGRDIVAMQFSKSASNLLLTCYGFQSPPADQSPRVCVYKDKGIACIWDVTLPYNLPRVLKCEGLITTGCFGPSRDPFALVGTEDGSIHVWDLRSSNASSACGIDDGLVFRSPTYSTCGIDYKTTNQHTSAIVALESIHDVQSSSKSAGGAAGGGNFQFGSMDDRGIVVIWSVVEFEAGDEALFADKCVEIGGRIKLVMNTWIDTQKQYMMSKKSMHVKRQGSSDTLADPKGDKKDTAAKVFPLRVGPIATVFKFFPSEPNQFVVGTQTGMLYRGHRFEQPSTSVPSVTYRRDRSWNTSQMGSSSQFNSAAVVCIDFHPHHTDYFLVGYEDGCISLFSSHVAVSLCSWEEMAFGISVCSMQWSTARSGVFMATFSNGHVLIWDLIQQIDAPVLASAIACLKEGAPNTVEGPILTPVGLEAISGSSAFCTYPLALSSEQTRTFRPVVAFRAGNCTPYQFSIQELCAELTVKAHNEAEDTKHCLNTIF